MDVGWATMGDLLRDPITGTLLSQAERHRMVVEAATWAEELGFWSASVGEHHFCDYVISSPPVVLAAMAERTETIRLGTAVALGSNNDPIRMAEDYATLDLLSGGRVELVVGRGNLYEHTFTAFGQDPAASRPIFEERVALLVEALRHEQLDWTGEHRPPFQHFTTQPRPLQAELPVWIGGGTSLASVDFAARQGLPLMLPGVIGAPRSFAPLVTHYRDTWAECGHDPADCRVGTIAHTYVASRSQVARETMRPRMATYMGWVRDLITISTPALADLVPPFDLDRLIERGPTVCGSPAEVVDKVGLWAEMTGMDLYLAMFDMGGMPPAELRGMMELFSAEVAPHLG